MSLSCYSIACLKCLRYCYSRKTTVNIENDWWVTTSNDSAVEPHAPNRIAKKYQIESNPNRRIESLNCRITLQKCSNRDLNPNRDCDLPITTYSVLCTFDDRIIILQSSWNTTLAPLWHVCKDCCANTTCLLPLCSVNSDESSHDSELFRSSDDFDAHCVTLVLLIVWLLAWTP